MADLAKGVLAQASETLNREADRALQWRFVAYESGVHKGH